MKSEHRHELQKNVLADRLADCVDWSRRNAQLLTGVVVGAVVVLGLFFYLRGRWQESSIAGWNEFFSAAGRQDTMQLETLATREAGTPPGQLAALMLADVALNAGVDLMNSDRTLAEERLNSAKNNYILVRDSSRDPLLKERATLGLARYYESVGLLEEAIKEYETLIGEQADGPYADTARRKIAFLKEPSTKAFAAWYREHKPLPPSPIGTGMPDFRNLDKLPPDETSFPPPSASPTASASATPSATATPSASPSATPAASPSVTPSATAKPSATGTSK